MSLDVHFGKETLAADADARESTAHAVLLVTQAVDPYKEYGYSL